MIKRLIKSLSLGIINAFVICGLAFGQTAALLPNGQQQFFDNSGKPLSFGKVYFYIPSTSTLKTTWQDPNETTPNTNPVILDSAGRATIYGNGQYRQLLTTSANVTIWDKLTSSTGTGGSSPVTLGDGNSVGTVLPWAGLTAPSQYVFAYGQEVSRATYPEFFTAITISQAVVCASGSPILSGLPDTTQIPVGAHVEASCTVPGSNVISKTTTSITLNNNATANGTVTATIFPYGNGNGSTTFNVPDLRGRVLAGRDNMGGTAASRLTSTYFATPGLGAVGGLQSHQMTEAELVNHAHPSPVLTDPGHIHTATAPSHVGATLGGNNVNPGANVAASETMTVTVASAVTGITLAATTGTTGTSIASTIVQPTITLNYIIKITPDALSPVFTSIPLNNGFILVGNASNLAAPVAMSGAVAIDNTGLTTLTSAAFANPTATVGLTTVNGSATTAMRSDAAPPLSQAITPTWTGLHTWQGGVIVGSSTTSSYEVSATPGSNTFTPTTGSTPGNLLMRTGGTNCSGTNIYTTPGIGPAPSAGQLFVCADLADSTAGNFSGIFGLAYNSGTRFAAAITGIGVSTGVGGQSWAVQATAQCKASGTICQGINVEADIGVSSAVSVNAIPATVVIGPASSYCNSNNCNASTFFNILSNGDFVKADTIFQINDSTRNLLTSTGAILRALSTNVSTQDGIDLRNMTFSGFAFASTGTSLLSTIVGNSTVGGTLALKGTSNAAPVSDKVSFLSGTKNIWGFKQNPAGDVGGTYVECWPGNSASSQNAECDVISSIANAGLSFRMKGTFPFVIHAPSDQSQSALMCIYENELNGTDRMCLQAASSIATSFTLVWPNAVPGTNGAPLTSTTGGSMSWGTLTGTTNFVMSDSPTLTTQVTFSNAQALYTGSKTISGTTGLLDMATTITNNATTLGFINITGTLNGSGDLAFGLRLAPVLAPSGNITNGYGAIYGVHAAPAGGITISNFQALVPALIYDNAAGAVSNGRNILIIAPTVSGSLKPTTQYGIDIQNQGIAGLTNTYGINIQSQSGATNNYALAIAGGLTQIALTTDATHTDRTVCQDTTSNVLYFGSGAAGICLGTSSMRFKHNIVKLQKGLNEIMQLKPISYQYNAPYGDPNKDLYGFLAEDVVKVDPKLVGLDTKGLPNSVDWAGMLPMMVKAIQELKMEVDHLKRQRR